jgi:hypothetical protein
MSEEHVFWSRTGRAIHKSARCPAVRRVVRREMAAIVRGDVSLVGLVRSTDMAGGGLASEVPPDRFGLCRNACCYGMKGAAKA